MAFWTDAIGQDPRRNFRFKVVSTAAGADTFFGGQAAGGCWWAKKVDQPQPTVSQTKHSFLAHDYYWPARVKWNDVTLTLVDPLGAVDSQRALLAAMDSVGAGVPTEGNWRTIGKQQANAALGDLQVQSINEAGEVISEWVLKHAWVMELNFSPLDYENENLMELTLKIKYDWAEFTKDNTVYLDPVTP
jgi:hypothetical protein